MGPSPDALWEVEGISIGLRTVKIPLKGIHREHCPFGTEGCLMVRYIGGKKQTYGACCIGNSGVLVVFIDFIHALFHKGRSLLVVCTTELPGAN